jgi:hypothetical protein
MSREKVERFMNDLGLTHPDVHTLAQAARAMIRSVIPNADERMMYGGILFSAPEDFCGVFAYSAHVSIEFGKGAQMKDAHGVLEGNGKFRRHIKLRSTADIESKHLKEYVRQAQRISTEASS